MSSTQGSLVLVVDDNAENRALAQATLEDEGYEVVLAGSGAEGLARFREREPDCVLLDVRMPDLDGFEVCSQIRSTPEGAHTPIVFLTALRDVDTFDRALLVGGDDFLTKPVRPAELVVRVQSALKLKKLSAELREHYDLVRSQRDALMRLQLQKERLSAFVVHDLKNPVGAMDLHAQLLLENKSLPAEVHESAQQIRDVVRSLMRLILNLLDISRGEEGKLIPNLQAVDLDRLGAEVFGNLGPMASRRKVELVSSLEVHHLSADPDLLRRVLENLLENAVRYAPRGTAVRVVSSLREGKIEVSVADAGSGIPVAMRDKVFDAFVQSEGKERTGRGLGLTFCKLAVEAHGGTLTIEDAQPGARFCMRFPNADG